MSVKSGHNSTLFSLWVILTHDYSRQNYRVVLFAIVFIVVIKRPLSVQMKGFGALLVSHLYPKSIFENTKIKI